MSIPSKLNMKRVAFVLCGLLAIALGRSIETDTIYESRVVHGEEAKIGERPFQVSLQSSPGSNFCGGSILNEYWVVTAAHCVIGDKPSHVKVVVGTVDLKKPYSSHQAEQLIVHEKYQSTENDIALIKVTTPFAFSYRVQPVALPEPRVNVKTNSTAVLSGWGRLLDWSIPNKLQKVSIYIADPEYCATIMKEQNQKIYPTNVCANDPSMRKGQCNGDSGGPLTVDGKLTGIVSWSIKDPDCASTKFPGVYTRVSEYVDWIYKHIQ